MQRIWSSKANVADKIGEDDFPYLSPLALILSEDPVPVAFAGVEGDEKVGLDDEEEDAGACTVMCKHLLNRILNVILLYNIPLEGPLQYIYIAHIFISNAIKYTNLESSLSLTTSKSWRNPAKMATPQPKRVASGSTKTI